MLNILIDCLSVQKNLNRDTNCELYAVICKHPSGNWKFHGYFASIS